MLLADFRGDIVLYIRELSFEYRALFTGSGHRYLSGLDSGGMFADGPKLPLVKAKTRCQVDVKDEHTRKECCR